MHSNIYIFYAAKRLMEQNKKMHSNRSTIQATAWICHWRVRKS